MANVSNRVPCRLGIALSVFTKTPTLRFHMDLPRTSTTSAIRVCAIVLPTTYERWRGKRRYTLIRKLAMRQLISLLVGSTQLSRNRSLMTLTASEGYR